MHVAVLGSGVIGTTIAYYLARDGHQVTVLDRQPGPALETSFANAGEVSPGYSSPWAGPGVPVKAIKWMLMTHSPLVIWPMLDAAMWRWGWSMLMNCTERAYRINKSRMVPIAEYSRDCLKQLRADTGIAYDERMQGTLQLFRTQKQLDGIAKDIEILRDYKVPYEVLDRAGFCRAEPALAHTQQKFVGALRLPNDETGDCYKFTQRIAALAQEAGASFRFNTPVEGLEVERGRISGCANRRWFVPDRFLCLRARKFLSADATTHRYQAAGVSGQGLLHHCADHRGGACAGVDDHGRDAQGRRDPSGRPDSRWGNGGAGRLQPDAA